MSKANIMTEERHPISLEETYKILNNTLSADVIEYVKKLKVDDIIQLHFTLGLWIRNNFRVSDDMSQTILRGYNHYLNSKDIDGND